MNRAENPTPGERCAGCGSLLNSPPGGEAACPACVAAGFLAEKNRSEGAETGQERTPFRAPVPRGDEDLELPWIEIPGFELLECVGRGSMGVVYRAKQKAPHREVAIKILSSPGVVTSREARQRFEREIELAGRLRHPGIVPIYESGLAHGGGIFFYVMELVEGRSLDRSLVARPLALDAKLILFAKVCAAVVYAHRQGVIHRDLTPANILVAEDGDPRLLDFGLGKALSAPDRPAATQLSLPSSVLGSPCTMSPEQAAGKPDPDTRSDVYSLGAILYFLATGHWPHAQEGNVIDVLHRIAHEPARPAARFAPKLGSGLQAILDRALATDPDRRYQSAKDLAEDVRRYREKQELSVQPLAALQRLGLWRRRKPLAAALWAISILLVMTLAVGGPVVALQQTRLRAALEQREAARHRSLVRLLLHADPANLLELFRAMEDDLAVMAPLLREQLATGDSHPGSELRLKAALFPAEPALEGELLRLLKSSSQVVETQLIAHALRPRAGALAGELRSAVESGKLAPKSGVLFNHFVALADWIPETDAFWESQTDAVLTTLITASNRRGVGSTGELAAAFEPVGHHLKPHLQNLAIAGNRPARMLLSRFIDREVGKIIETALASDHGFQESFPLLEANRVEAMAGLTAIYEAGRARFRELPPDGEERARVARAAVGMIRLDRHCNVWRQLGYSWPMREVLIEKIPKLGADPALLHWKLRRTNDLTRPHEATRSALARCFLAFRPDEFSTEVRDNIVKRQREVLAGTAPSSEAEPIETARRLLQAWGYAEASAPEVQ